MSPLGPAASPMARSPSPAAGAARRSPMAAPLPPRRFGDGVAAEPPPPLPGGTLELSAGSMFLSATGGTVSRRLPGPSPEDEERLEARLEARLRGAIAEELQVAVRGAAEALRGALRDEVCGAAAEARQLLREAAAEAGRARAAADEARAVRGYAPEAESIRSEIRRLGEEQSRLDTMLQAVAEDTARLATAVEQAERVRRIRERDDLAEASAALLSARRAAELGETGGTEAAEPALHSPPNKGGGSASPSSDFGRRSARSYAGRAAWARPGAPQASPPRRPSSAVAPELQCVGVRCPCRVERAAARARRPGAGLLARTRSSPSLLRRAQEGV